MKKESLDAFKNRAKQILLNKYWVTLIVFAFIFLFVGGEQNAISFIKRQVQISRMNSDLERYKAASLSFQHKLETLKSIDSLECFARERYLMKTDNEVIFLIDE